MKNIYLGHSDLSLSRIGFGCMSLHQKQATTGSYTNDGALFNALNCGINFFDTADIYGDGYNEELLGRFIKSQSQKVVIATKVGLRFNKTSNTTFVDNSSSYIKSACDASLRRLKVDVIDLYYIHRIDSKTPIEETIGVMSNLVNDGKVRYLGICNIDANTLIRANNVYKISAVQNEYSLLNRDAEKDIIPLCQDLGITFVAYSPLGRGFLTGRLTSEQDFDDINMQQILMRFKNKNIQNYIKTALQVIKIASRNGCTPAQLSLAYLLYKNINVIPIPGSQNYEHIKENCKSEKIDLSSFNLTDLSYFD